VGQFFKSAMVWETWQHGWDLAQVRCRELCAAYMQSPVAASSKLMSQGSLLPAPLLWLRHARLSRAAWSDMA
jgi:hypothetical protein